MKKGVYTFLIELAISIIVSVLFNQGMINYDFFTLLGLVNLIMGGLSLFISLILLLIDKQMAKSFFIATGLLLLVGGLTCSIFPIRLNFK